MLFADEENLLWYFFKKDLLPCFRKAEMKMIMLEVDEILSISGKQNWINISEDIPLEKFIEWSKKNC